MQTQMQVSDFCSTLRTRILVMAYVLLSYRIDLKTFVLLLSELSDVFFVFTRYVQYSDSLDPEYSFGVSSSSRR
jgi:hypothetical protein